jgi:hypothetical protein
VCVGPWHAMSMLCPRAAVVGAALTVRGDNPAAARALLIRLASSFW